MEPIKWHELVRGLLCIVVATISALPIPLYAVNGKDPDTVFWVAMAVLIAILGANGIDVVLNRKS